MDSITRWQLTSSAYARYARAAIACDRAFNNITPPTDDDPHVTVNETRTDHTQPARYHVHGLTPTVIRLAAHAYAPRAVTERQRMHIHRITRDITITIEDDNPVVHINALTADWAPIDRITHRDITRLALAALVDYAHLLPVVIDEPVTIPHGITREERTYPGRGRMVTTVTTVLAGRVTAIEPDPHGRSIITVDHGTRTPVRVTDSAWTLCASPLIGDTIRVALTDTPPSWIRPGLPEIHTDVVTSTSYRGMITIPADGTHPYDADNNHRNPQ